ncbi:hypothetical protein ACFPFP_00045 [Bradyrhizobium sp. GCM10023182]|uniref:Uncharacterized protein n=1 Tax=Bradyrhizobium zhengyangense TaxID=2911009 RepID=A0ABS9LE79_9BRAD|nr:hypothetical protein [Bradyrhizobium zhengyangense]MCG2665317.1 hypothetical protein [Bradyrhizobium zhengyangense]
MPFTPAPLDASNRIPSVMPGLPPPVDGVELLPLSRRPLMLSLRQRSEDLQNLVRPLLDKLDELRADKHVLSVRLAELKRPRGQGGSGLDDEHTSVVEVQRKLAAIDGEMRRLSELIEVRRARAQSAARLVASVESWLREGRSSGRVIVEAAEIEIAMITKRNESIAGALDRLRHRLRELAADQHRNNSAPYPAAHAKARARAMVEQLAERGAVDVSALVEADAEIGWPLAIQRLGLAGIVAKTGDQLAGNAMAEVIDTVGLFVWLHRDALVSRLEEEIDAIADDAAALSVKARAEKLAQISADKLTAERQECALVRRMQDDGLWVEYRADADPRAVLGVELDVPSAEPDVRQPFGMAAKALAHARAAMD